MVTNVIDIVPTDIDENCDDEGYLYLVSVIADGKLKWFWFLIILILMVIHEVTQMWLMF